MVVVGVLQGRLDLNRLALLIDLKDSQTHSHCYLRIPASLPTLTRDACANWSAISAASDVDAEEGDASVVDAVCILEAAGGSRSLQWDRGDFPGTSTAAAADKDWAARCSDECRQIG